MWRSFARVLTQFDINKVDAAIALRNAVGVVVPLAVGVAGGMPLGGIAVATGALQVSYSDGHDPYSRRGFRMLLAAVLCALAVMIGGLVGNSAVLATIAVVAWGFAAGLVVILGSDAEGLGVISLVTLIIYAAQSLTIHRALISGGLAFGGGLLQTAISIALWPLSRHEPERRALANLYRTLSQSALASMNARDAPPATAEMTQAQDLLGRLGRDHGSDAQRLWSLLDQAERIRLSLVALGRLRNRMARDVDHSPALERLQHYLQRCADVLDRIADTLISHKAPESTLEKVEELRSLSENYGSDDAAALDDAVRTSVRRQLDAITGQLRAAFRLATNQVVVGAEIAPREAMPSWRERFFEDLAGLQANLTLQSPGFRHAIRLAATLAIGEVTAHSISTRRAYWLPMTISLVLKPEFSVTVVRGLLRVFGTIAGLVLATALFHFLHPALATEVLSIGAFVFLVRWIGPANYGVFAINISALVVLLVAFTGIAPMEAIRARGLMTTLGGTVALIAYAVWPTWEIKRSSEMLAQMLDAYKMYFARVARMYLVPQEISVPELHRRRLQARRARSSMEATVDRLQLEPLTNRTEIRALSSMMASCHRFINAAMALEAVHQQLQPAQIVPMRQFCSNAECMLNSLAAVLRGREISEPDLPDLRQDHNALLASTNDKSSLLLDEADRVTNSLNTLAEQVLAWRGEKVGVQSPIEVPT